MTDILFNHYPIQDGYMGVITLNRAKALNALSYEMIQLMTQCLIQWQEDTKIKLVLLRSNSDHVFCAGGDIRYVYSFKEGEKTKLIDYFKAEYLLNHYIYQYPKPFISIMNGLTMGGGVGIAGHASYRVGTEQLLWAMPETGIGLFPDVGGRYLLNQCPGEIGIYLGLTGNTLSFGDCYYAGLVDYFIPSHQVEKFLNDLAKLKDVSNLPKYMRKYCNFTKEAQLPQQIELIDECFNHDNVETIVEKLREKSTPWSKSVLETLSRKSPTSLKVTLRALRMQVSQALSEYLKVDFRLINHFLLSHDLYEGIRATIIDKDKHPLWKPNRLFEVTDKMVNEYFKPLQEELEFVF